MRLFFIKEKAGVTFISILQEIVTARRWRGLSAACSHQKKKALFSFFLGFKTIEAARRRRN
jgi:hypothetical protein